MKTKALIIFSFFFAGCAFFVAAQEGEKQNQVNVNIQVRPRAEYRDGYKDPLLEGEKAAGFINQRSRLSVDYLREGLSVGLSLQNVSVWGQNPIANSSNSNTVVNEAWAQLKNSDGYFLKFGRQTLNYNDGRLFSAADWNQAGFYHDALKLGYLSKSHQLEAVLAFNQDGEKSKGGSFYTGGGIPYKNMQMIYYQYNDFAGFTPSFLFANTGYENGVAINPETVYLQTMGTHLIFKPIDELKIQGVAYYQTGKRKTSLNKISATMLSLRAEYLVNKATKLFGGIDFVSGEDANSSQSNTTYNAFNTLHAGNHAFYGSMDYFIASSYRNGMNLGINDKYLGVVYAPISRYSFAVTYHYFSMAANAYDNGKKIKKGMGSEIDLQFDYNIMKDVKLSCGYSSFFGTKSLEFAKGGDSKRWQDWAFMSVSVNPRIFSAKW